MPKKSRDYRGELRHIMNALADAVAEASDEELRHEAQEAEIDLQAEAENVRAVLRRSVDKFRKRRLAEARRDYETQASILLSKAYELPKTPREKRDLLTSILTAKPQMQGIFTVQFRELDQLSDDDIENFLRKLAELGILDDISEKPTGE